MGDQSLEAFFVHLAQQDFEHCESLVADCGSLTPLFRNVMSFELFYFGFEWVRHEDSNRSAILEVLEGRIRYAQVRSPLFAQLLAVVDVRIQLSSVYQSLSKDFRASRTFYPVVCQLSQTLRDLSCTELQPYRDACQYEVQSLAALLQSSLSVSAVQYYTSVIHLCRAKQCLQKWELLFIHKRLAPTTERREYNNIYTCHVQLLHRLLAKAAIYFHYELEAIVDAEEARFGDELKSKCGLRRVEATCLMLKTTCCFFRVDKATAKLLYAFPKETELPRRLQAAASEVSRGVAVQREIDDQVWQVTVVEDGIYIGMKGAGAAIAEVCLGVAGRLATAL